MEILTTELIDKLTGELWSDCGYAIKSRQLPDGRRRHFTARISPPPFIGYDPLHWEYIKAIVTIVNAKADPLIRDIRISLRELAAAEYDAHHFRGVFWTRDEYKPWIRRVAATLRLKFKHNIKPSTKLNAQQAQRVITWLEQLDEGKVKLVKEKIVD